jgi:hypothetical protein
MNQLGQSSAPLALRTSAIPAEAIKNKETGITEEQQATARNETERMRSMEARAKDQNRATGSMPTIQENGSLPTRQAQKWDGSPIVTRPAACDPNDRGRPERPSPIERSTRNQAATSETGETNERRDDDGSTNDATEDPPVRAEATP